jgi:hypothetical protein
MRVYWTDGPIIDYFSNRRKGWVQNLLGTWWNAIEMDVIADDGGVKGPTYYSNLTVINEWDPLYNWTKWTCVENNLIVFITTRESESNNISQAILDTGIVTVTVASAVFTSSEDVGIASFVSWYRTVVFAGGQQWGMPSFMTWVVRIFSFMMILSGIILAKELREFLPI